MTYPDMGDGSGILMGIKNSSRSPAVPGPRCSLTTASRPLRACRRTTRPQPQLSLLLHNQQVRGGEVVVCRCLPHRLR